MKEKEVNDNTNIFTIVGISIALSAYAWDLSFNLGAFGTIFFGHIIAIWLFSLSILLITIVVKQYALPGEKWLPYVMLPLPSIWLILRIIDNPLVEGLLTDHLLSITGTLSIAISLPYLIYLFLYFNNPAVLQLQKKMIVSLLGFVFLIGGMGYVLGSHNYLIMSCKNFVVSGQDTPENCLCKKEEIKLLTTPSKN